MTNPLYHEIRTWRKRHRFMPKLLHRFLVNHFGQRLAWSKVVGIERIPRHVMCRCFLKEVDTVNHVATVECDPAMPTKFGVLYEPESEGDHEA